MVKQSTKALCPCILRSKNAGAFTKKIQKRRNDIMQMLKDGMTLDATNKRSADKYLIQDENGGITLNNKVFQEANQHAGILCLYQLLSEMVSRLTTVIRTDVLLKTASWT